MGERQQVLCFVRSETLLSIPPPCAFSSPIGLGYLHLHAHWSPPSGRLIMGCMPPPSLTLEAPSFCTEPFLSVEPAP